jgi:tricorn protease
VTVPGEKGDVRNLTNSAGVHDRSPSWSPDGRSIAWFSDQGGEYQLSIGSQDGKGEPRVIKVAGAGFYSDPVWSPDSQKIAYWDNSQSVYWMDVASGVTKKIASQPLYGPNVMIGYDWSPDSKWLAYAMNNKANITTVYAHSVEQGKSFQVSDGLSDVSNPVFDKSGKYLFFLGSTDAGPVRDWFALSNADMRATSAVYLAVLQNDVVSPLARESDEEKPAAAANGQETRRGACSRARGEAVGKEGRAVPHRLRGTGVPNPRPADSARRSVEPPGRLRGPDLLPEDRRSGDIAEPL